MSSTITITRAALTTAHLPLVKPLHTSKGDIVSRDTVVIALVDERGAVAHGEAAPLPGYSSESIAEVEEALRALSLVGISFRRPDEVEAILANLSLPASARHAVDQALLSLIAVRRGIGLASILHPGARSTVPIHALVTGPDDARVAASGGAKCLKIKVGGRTLDQDEARIAAIREVIPAAVKLRLDANGAWTAGRALEALHRFARFGLQCVEQPVAREDIEGLALVRRGSPTPVMADESVHDLADLDRVIAAGAADAIVIKPMIAGGPTRALAIAARAADAGLPVSITSMIDGAIARRAAIAVAAACPGTLWTCGLPSHLLASDVRPLSRDPWIEAAPAIGRDAGASVALETGGPPGHVARIGGGWAA